MTPVSEEKGCELPSSKKQILVLTQSVLQLKVVKTEKWQVQFTIAKMAAAISPAPVPFASYRKVIESKCILF
jgi:hypothetical protein